MQQLRRAAIAAVFLWITGLFAQAQAFDKEPRLAPPNAQGHRLYIIALTPDAVKREIVAPDVQTRAPMDPANAEDFRGWHRPKVRALVERLESRYGLEAQSMTSYAAASFAAYIPDSLLERVRGDPDVEKITPVFGALDFSQVPPWSDQFIGNERIPWGKSATGTNDTLATGNVVYMIDGGMPPANNDLTNVIATPVNPGLLLSQAHASHVAGILSAAMNGQQVRGVNPGAQILNVNRGGFDNEIQTALDWVLADAESRGVYAVANISSNSTRWAEGDPSDLALFMRRLSNRVLVVQSAGNGNITLNAPENACNVATGPARPQDGVIVVSGVDEQGLQAIPFDNTGIGWSREPGANFGSCVEMWAPAQHVWSTWDSNASATQILSGTSMAAPHIAALAARYGDSTTTPVQREAYVRARLRNTGFADQQGANIVVPSYLQAPAFAIPSRLRNLTANAIASMSGTSPAYVNDGLYLSTNIWNAGQGAPAWIELDLIYPRKLSTIRLTPEQFPRGQVVHEIYAGNAPAPTTLAATISQNSMNLAVLTANFGDVTARYVRVLTTSSPSWVAWREIEVYATVRTDETTMDSFYLGLLNRPADAGGYAFWLGQLRSARCNDVNSVHGTLDWISSSFINGVEFQAQGLSNQAFVTAMYKGLLRRDPDAGGLAYWTNELNTGARTREDVRLSFVYSTEFVLFTVSPVMNESCTSI